MVCITKVWAKLALVSCACLSAVQAAEIRFNDDIRPIIAEHCLSCHGPDESSRQADLRLDIHDGALAVITRDELGESELIRRVMESDPELVMPPPDFGKDLSSQQKQVLSEWIRSGAEWAAHWSFEKPGKRELPDVEGVKQWALSPIDYFIYQKLRANGLTPNPEADRYRLARRLALDITGLPPDPEWVSEFVENPARDAYGQYVDRLLESDHAGEHRARFWLDAARYGDTHGMHVDNYREMWPYRDWVVRAFTANMPFDQFVVEQVAGDLLDDPTLDQLVATGFNRCNITTSEGGAIPAELDVRYMVDRVETASTVFMALTAGCAVCHDHKYDPITQREFYQLGAFFNNTTQPAMDGNRRDTIPVVTLPAAEFSQEWRALQSQRSGLVAELAGRDTSAEKWWSQDRSMIEHPVADDELVLWWPLSDPAVTGGLGGQPAMEKVLPENVDWAQDHPEPGRGVRFAQKGGISAELPRLGSDRPFSVSFWFRTPDEVTIAKVLEQEITVEKPEGNQRLGWSVTNNTQGAIDFELHDGEGKTFRGKLADNEALRPRSWQHICIRYSGGQALPSVTILADTRQAFLRVSEEQLVQATDLADVPLVIGGNLPAGGMSDLRVFQRWLSDEEVELLAQEFELRRVLASGQSWQQLDKSSRQLVETFYAQVHDTEYQRLSRELAETQKRYDFIYARSTTTLVTQERSTAPSAWVLQRGEYDQPVEQVTPGTPSILSEWPDGAPKNRLGLAKWLVHPDHPLTARVMVNRLWQSLFGVGLVKTSEDFGIMGDRPSHPELLDWLAVEFIESGWDVRHMIRLMVNSASYRQSARTTSLKLSVDADNRLLSRGPRYRLDAEVLRDQALAISGLLQRQPGGPSVKPYQPAGLWKVVAIAGSNTQDFRRDNGDALYRRSLYTFWKRTSPPPSMSVFNAPTREQCTVRRERTNTPLQALVLMNDTQYVEAAREFAELAVTNATEDHQLAAWMLRRALVVTPNEKDVEALVALAENCRKRFEQQPDDAQGLLEIGESTIDASLDPIQLAAWTVVANTIMNRDDFVSK